MDLAARLHRPPRLGPSPARQLIRTRQSFPRASVPPAIGRSPKSPVLQSPQLTSLHHSCQHQSSIAISFANHSLQQTSCSSPQTPAGNVAACTKTPLPSNPRFPRFFLFEPAFSSLPLAPFLAPPPYSFILNQFKKVESSLCRLPFECSKENLFCRRPLPVSSCRTRFPPLYVATSPEASRLASSPNSDRS